MVRFTIVAASILCLPIAVQAASESPQSELKSPEGSTDASTKTPSGKAEETESLKKAVKSLSPDQKQRLTENIKAWKQLTPEQRETLKLREETLRKQASEEVAAAVKELPEGEREAFIRRYMEERRKLQLTLRQEMEAKRKAGLADVIQRLKQENAASTTPETTSTQPATNP